MASQASLNVVQQLYVAYYGRPADAEGLQYWADRLEAEGESAIINAFGNSAEYEELSEGQGYDVLVNNLYLQMFSRDAEAEGLEYWVGVLESGEKSLAEIALTIKNAAGGSDEDVLAAKVVVADQYTEVNIGDTYNIDLAKQVVVNINIDNYHEVEVPDSDDGSSDDGSSDDGSSDDGSSDDGSSDNGSSDNGDDESAGKTFTLTEVDPSLEKTFLWDGVDTSSLQEMLAYANEVNNRGGSDVTDVADGDGGDETLFFDTAYVDALETILGNYAGMVDEQVSLNPAVLTPTDNNDGVIETGFTTDADDIIVAGTPYALQGAYIDGGEGYNTLVVDMKGPFAQAKQLLNVQEVQVHNVENYYGTSFFDYNNSGRTGNASTGFEQLLDNAASSDSILDLSRAVDLEKVLITSSAAGNSELTVLGINNYATARLEGGFEDNVTLHYSRGQGDVLNVEMANVTFTDGNFAIAHNVGALHLTSEGRSNILSNVDFGTHFQELTVDGSGLLSIEGKLNFAFGEAHIDASENTGGLRLNINTVTQGLEEVTLKGSQARDVIDIEGTAPGVQLDVDTGAGRDTVMLKGVDAGAGSVITGENLTVEVESARLTQADVSGVDRFVLNAAVAPALILTAEQVSALGADVFEAAHELESGLGIVIDEDTTLSELMDLSALSEDVKLYFDIAEDATLTLTAEELHQFVAADGIDVSTGLNGKVVITDAGIDYNAFDGSEGGSLKGSLATSDDLTIVRTEGGFERPEPVDTVNKLTLDSTGDAALEVDGLEATKVSTLEIIGDQDVAFTDDVTLGEEFTVDFSALEGQVVDLTITNFDDVEEVIGNGVAGTRINVELDGDVAKAGADTGLMSSGVEQYVVTDMNEGDHAFNVCDNTQDVQVLGLQGNMAQTLTFTNIPWGAVNPTILLEGDGKGDWTELSKADGSPNQSNVGTVVANYFFDGAPANVLITNQGVAPGETSGGEARPIVIEGIVVDNAKSLNITAEDGNAIIESISDNGSGAGLDDVTLTSANDVTLKLDGDNLDSIDATGVAGTATLQIEADTDFSDTDLAGIDAVVLEDGVTVTHTIAQIQAIGAENLTVENEGDEATLNVAGLGNELFALPNASEGISLGQVIVLEGEDVVLDAATDLSGATGVEVPEGSSVTMTAAQFLQFAKYDQDGLLTTSPLVTGNGLLNVTDVTQDAIDAGFSLNNVSAEAGRITLAEDVVLDNDTDLGAFSIRLADGQTIELANGVQANERVVTIEEGATNTTVEFGFDSLTLAYQLTNGYQVDVSNYSADLAELQVLANFIEGLNVEDVLLDFDSGITLDIFEPAAVEDVVNSTNRVVTIQPNTDVDGGLIFDDSRDDYRVETLDMTLLGGVNINGSLDVSEGILPDAGFQTLTLNSEGTSANEINGSVLATYNNLLNVVVNAEQAIKIDEIVFSSETDGKAATLTLSGAGDITIDTLNATSVNVDTLNIVNNATGTVNVPGAGPAIELAAGANDVSNLVITGTGSEINFGTADTDESNSGVNVNDLASIDASGYAGDLNLGIITGNVAESLTVTGSQGVTALTLGDAADAGNATAPFSMAATADVTIDLSGSAAGSTVTLTDEAVLPALTGVAAGDAGSLTISAETLVIAGNVDLAQLVDADGNNKLDLGNVTTIEVAADSSLNVTAEQLDALNDAGVAITKQAFDADAGELEGLVRVSGIEGDLTAANPDLEADLALSQADVLVLEGNATFTGEQVSDREVQAAASNVTVTGVTADTDLSGILTTGSLTVQAGADDTTLTLAADVISALALNVEGDSLETVEVVGVEAIVGAEGDVDEGQVNANFSGLTATGLDVVYQLDSTDDVSLKGADFAAAVATAGSTTLQISGNGTVSAEGNELTIVDAIDVGADATLALNGAQHAVVAGIVEGDGTLQVTGLGDSFGGFITAGDEIDKVFTFSDNVTDGDVSTLQDLVHIDSFINQGVLHTLDFTAFIESPSFVEQEAQLDGAANQGGLEDILSFNVATLNEDGIDLLDLKDELAAAFEAGNAFNSSTTDDVVFGSGEEKIFFVSDGSNTEGYLWADATNEDGKVQADELSQLVELTGVDAEQLISANFEIA